MIRRVFLALILSVASFSAFGQSGDAGTVRNDAQLNVPVYRITIKSSDADSLALAKRAFALHGSYRQVPESKAQFVFTFTPVGDKSVKLSINGGTSAEQVVNGSNYTEALMKACDAAVTKTLRTKGFFAGKLAFSYSKNKGKSTEICISDMVFRNVRALTRDNSDSIFPHFSPDGSKLIYTGYFRTGFMDLFIIDLNSNSRKTFASFKGSNTGGSFSPDGSKVALILTSTGNAEVWTASASGTNFKRITKTNATESSPSFSPDGSKLLFAGDYRGSPQIYILPVGGGKPSVIPANLSRYCSEPTWNPVNPDLVAFTIAQGRGFQVAVYDLKTRKAKVVSQGDSTSGPQWLSDGRHLVCTKSRGTSRQLYVIDSETDCQRPLHTTSFGDAKEPDFVYAPR